MANTIISRADAKALGLKRYFTGEPCPHRHISERRVSDCSCIECGRIKSRDPEERERRREYMRQHQAKLRSERPEHMRATSRKSYAKHAEKRAAEKRAAYAADPEKMRQASRRSWARNSDRYKPAMKAWREANAELVREHKRNYKARKRNAEGKHSADDIDALFDAQNGSCNGCGADLTGGYHVDHVIPVSRGGSNWANNLQLLCPFCNVSKKDKTMEEWLAIKAVAAE